MRVVKYKTHWSYAGKAVKREATLTDFVLDIPYLMNDTGVIPPFDVLNQVLVTGGDNGGMGPGASWKPFTLSRSEYIQLREELLKLDILEAKIQHPYISFSNVIEDAELDEIIDYREWLKVSFQKHHVQPS
jgi:hypothetical protein